MREAMRVVMAGQEERHRLEMEALRAEIAGKANKPGPRPKS